jgi:alpha-L-fucosidase
MLLNTPPNSTGLLHDTDVKILQEFKSTIESIFSQNLASKARISASSTRGSEATSLENSPFRPEQVLTDDLNEYWAVEDGLSSGHLQLDLGANVTFNVVKIQEAVNMGQRVKKYHVDVWQGASWHTVVHGTTIGYKKLDQITLTSTQLVRLVIDDARAQPLIASFGLYLDARTKVTCGGSNSTHLSSPTVKTVSVI